MRVNVAFRHEEWLVGNVTFYLKFWARYYGLGAMSEYRLEVAVFERGGGHFGGLAQNFR